LSQLTIGAADGEIYEQLFFAAVQLASHSSNLELLDVVNFVDALEPYICEDKKEVTFVVGALLALRLKPSVQTRQVSKRAKLVWHPKPLSQKHVDKVIPKVQEVQDIKKQLCGYKIPWLVPAYNGTDLLEYREGLFPDGMIAGLVPSKPNARFDAHAYVVSQSNSTDWVFEFRVRSEKYALLKAVKHLETKCKSEGSEGKFCHAMLIAFSAKSESKACAWFDDKLICVVVIFGDA